MYTICENKKRKKTKGRNKKIDRKIIRKQVCHQKMIELYQMLEQHTMDICNRT